MPRFPTTPLGPFKKTVTLDQLWPVIATSVQFGSARQDYPPAIAHQSVVLRLTRRADTSTLIELGPQNARGPEGFSSQRQWRPTAANDIERSRLFRRVHSDCIAVETNLAVLFAMHERLVEFGICITWYNKHLIDYGIVCGRVAVPPQDRLAYKMSNGNILLAQDPDDHAWLFEASDGELIYGAIILYCFIARSS